MNVSSLGSRPPPIHRLRGELDRTAVEVAEFLAHLFEREPEGKRRSAALTGRLSVRPSSRASSHSSKAASAVSGSRAVSASALPRR